MGWAAEIAPVLAVAFFGAWDMVLVVELAVRWVVELVLK